MLEFKWKQQSTKRKTLIGMICGRQDLYILQGVLSAVNFTEVRWSSAGAEKPNWSIK